MEREWARLERRQFWAEFMLPVICVAVVVSGMAGLHSAFPEKGDAIAALLGMFSMIGLFAVHLIKRGKK